MSKILVNIILFITACIVLVIISKNLITEKKVPSLGDLLASSTVQVASSTVLDANSTAQVTGMIKRTAFDFPNSTLSNAQGSIKVFIAKNAADREQGLSDITDLPKAVGVLFAFDKPGKYGFWMKDMNFPLDLIWINANKKIVGVTKNALPKSYPFVFMPPSEITYVLEMNAGSVANYKLLTGSSVDFSI